MGQAAAEEEFMDHDGNRAAADGTEAEALCPLPHPREVEIERAGLAIDGEQRFEEAEAMGQAAVGGRDGQGAIEKLAIAPDRGHAADSGGMAGRFPAQLAKLRYFVPRRCWAG